MTHGQTTSLTLLGRVRAQDPDAWRRLLVLYAPLIDSWCRRWGIVGHDADDVRQEVFQAVAGNLEQFDPADTGGTFRGWLRGITRHKLLDLFRRRDRDPEARGGTDAQLHLLQLPDANASLPDEPEEVTNLYHRALELIRGEFEERTWQAFWRAAVEGHSPAAVAADLGVTPAAVRKAKSRVLRRLRQQAGDLIG